MTLGQDKCKCKIFLYLIVEEFACDELILAAGLALSLLTSGSLSLRSLNLGIRLKRLASLSLVVGERPDDLGLSSSSFLLSVEGSVLTEPCSDLNPHNEDDILSLQQLTS